MISTVYMSWSGLLTGAYVVMGFVALVGYIPQLLTFWKNPFACMSTPLATWSLWGAQTVVFHIYAWVVNGDRMFILTTGLFMVATLVALALLLRGKVLAHRTVTAGAPVADVVQIRRAA